MPKSLREILLDCKDELSRIVAPVHSRTVNASFVKNGGSEAILIVHGEGEEEFRVEITLEHDRLGGHVNIKRNGVQAECFEEDAKSIQATAVGLLCEAVFSS